MCMCLCGQVFVVFVFVMCLIEAEFCCRVGFNALTLLLEVVSETG